MTLMERLRGRRREADADSVLRARRLLKDHLRRQEATAGRFWELARRALQLQDEAQFAQIARQYVWSLEDIQRWRRYELALEATEVRRDQARSVGDFMRSVKGLSGSLLAGVDSQSRRAVEAELAAGIEKAENLEQVMGRLLALTEDTVLAMGRVREVEGEPLLDELEAAIARHGGVAGADRELDARVAEGMRLIARQARRGADDEFELPGSVCLGDG